MSKRPNAPRGGTVFVQGTSTAANVVTILPGLDARGNLTAGSALADDRQRERPIARWNVFEREHVTVHRAVVPQGQIE